jgi:hypothetical protein
MKKNFIIICLILLAYLLLVSYNYGCVCEFTERFTKRFTEKFTEKFDYIDNTSSYKSDTDKTQPIYYNEVDYKPTTNINCCSVQKKYLPDSSNQLGGSFKYEYEKLSNEQCDLKKHTLDSNNGLLIDGYNGWSNDRCTNNKTKNKIGSCRSTNKECIDFVEKQYCDKYQMTWSNKTCNDPLEYTWVDKIKFNKPIYKDDGTFNMFDKESQMSNNNNSFDNLLMKCDNI